MIQKGCSCADLLTVPPEWPLLDTDPVQPMASKGCLAPCHVAFLFDVVVLHAWHALGAHGSYGVGGAVREWGGVGG